MANFAAGTLPILFGGFSKAAGFVLAVVLSHRIGIATKRPTIFSIVSRFVLSPGASQATRAR